MITRQEVLSALQKIDSGIDGFEKKTSTTYVLEHEGKRYPPMRVWSTIKGKDVLYKPLQYDKAIQPLIDLGFTVISKDTSSIKNLVVGRSYTKRDIARILDNPNISKIREGIYHHDNETTLLFVDLEKKGRVDRLHYNDFFEGEYFHWDSQTTQHIKSPKIREIVTGVRIPNLFVRVNQKLKSKTQPFIYCGRLKYEEYDPESSKPVHIVFQNIDYIDGTLNPELLDIYSWKPGKIGGSTNTKLSKKGHVSEKRKKAYAPPKKTEREGLVTSRVGQGYYRQQIIEKWGGECPVTGCNIRQVLIASHIVPWSESSNEERLDVENGILLSPDIDALFDKHLITFDDEGLMLISPSIDKNDLINLGIPTGVKIPVNHEMKPYLKRHRQKFEDISLF